MKPAIGGLLKSQQPARDIVKSAPNPRSAIRRSLVMAITPFERRLSCDSQQTRNAIVRPFSSLQDVGSNSGSSSKEPICGSVRHFRERRYRTHRVTANVSMASSSHVRLCSNSKVTVPRCIA